MPEAVEEMRSFLDNHLTKYGAEVMINISQPNVHVNGCKCYIIVDPIYGKHRLGVSNPRLSASEMAEMVD
ncbi:transcription termination factor Alc, partial [Streptococcus pyogenes]